MTEATQATFAELEYMAKKRKTRREKFLERMDGLVPWKELEDAIRPQGFSAVAENDPGDPKTPHRRTPGRSSPYLGEQPDPNACQKR